jgi:titin
MLFSSWRRALNRQLLSLLPQSRQAVRLRSAQPRVEPLEDRCLLSTFTVRTTADSGPDSLRDAIARVNSDPHAPADTIKFVIGSGVQTIVPLSPLPTLQHAVAIDGTSQPGFSGMPLIELDGASAGMMANGLVLTAGGSTVQGLVINRFSLDGILLQNKGKDIIAGNYLGTDTTGSMNLGNGGNGIEVSGVAGNTIGGTRAGAGNVISANGNAGILLTNAASWNVIQGNKIGTDVSGTMFLENGSPFTSFPDGVALVGASNNLVGGKTAGSGNLISANQAGDGILIEPDTQGHAASANRVQGNQVGTDVTGTVGLPNTIGVEVAGGTGNFIGGPAAGEGNLLSGDTFGVALGHQASGNLVQGNKIGTDITGTLSVNNFVGVVVEDSSNNLIGGRDAGAGNLISGNFRDGIQFFTSSLTTITTGNLIQGNKIGTDVTGIVALPNSNGLNFASGSNNTVGGAAPGAGNLISGNSQDGIIITNSPSVSRPSSGIQIEGNQIGTDVTGTRAVPNGLNGIEVVDSGNNVIGGIRPGAGNLISGNQQNGVLVTFNGFGPSASDNVLQGNKIGTDVIGTLALANQANGAEVSGASNTLIGGALVGAGNLISGNALDGVFLTGLFFFSGLPSGSNVLQGNKLGTDLTGTRAVPNGQQGVEEQFDANDLIGGSSRLAGDLISGNLQNGVFLSFSPTGGFGSMQGNPEVVEGNKIGTDITGKAALGNQRDGVLVQASNDVVGGTSAGTGNLISGNQLNGIELGPFFVPFGTTQTDLIEGNKIGTDLTGNAAVANQGDGIPANASGIMIGGTTPGTRNIISGNAHAGIVIGAAERNDVIEGNRIGTNAAGKAALGNAGDGIDLMGSAVVGGTLPGAGNLISGNAGDGIFANQAAPFVQLPVDLIIGNRIGTDITGIAPLGNLANGVHLLIGSIQIGEAIPGGGNVIAFNGNDGILVDGAPQNTISGNSIFANGNLGIEDINLGASSPVLTAAVNANGELTIEGTLATFTPSSLFTLEFFANPTCDPSGSGEGKTYLGSIQVTTDSNGLAPFSLILPFTVPKGQFITATATDSSGTTSEFSNCEEVL